VAQHAVDNAVTGIAFIAWNVGIFAANLNAITARGFDPDEIVNRERLVNSLQRMEMIGSRGTN
jgi:hypothetical protein